MKIVTLIARLLLGLLFVMSGAMSIYPFMKMPPPPPGLAGQFDTALMDSHYMQVVAVVMLISGLLLVVNRFVPLALVLLGPILFNILLYHALLMHAGFQAGVIATILWFLIFYRHRAAFTGIFQARA